MAQLLRYERATGTIAGVWESNNLALLEAQRVEGDTVYGYLLCTEPVDASTVEEAYQIVDGACVPRPVNTKDD
jgi:hypothetical protein